MLDLNHMVLKQGDQAAIGDLVPDREGRQAGDPEPFDRQTDQRIAVAVIASGKSTFSDGSDLAKGQGRSWPVVAER